VAAKYLAPFSTCAAGFLQRWSHVYPQQSPSSAAAFHVNRDIPRELHATTILAVRKGGKVVLIGDGQVCMGGRKKEK
jgi:hypothetical protein